MEPFTAFVALATTAVGAILGIQGASQATAAQQQQIALEEQIQHQQQQQMNLMANRQKIEQVRKGLQAQAMAKTAATEQGAAAGSGLPGGEAQVFGQERWNVGGIQQAQDIGNKIYGYTYGIDQAQIQMANAYGLMGLGQGLMQVGGVISQNQATINRVGTDIGGLYQGYSSGFGTTFPSR
ncbi:MAG TPA: hypothetical protein VEP90_26125 [Methylomirabilota bacterium]|nr:hypothetical protein [Methylomirabilota bacterium]